MLERARAEVAPRRRREDITRQLGHLSGVIEALAVPETTRTWPLPGRHSPAHQSTSTTPRPPPTSPTRKRNRQPDEQPTFAPSCAATTPARSSSVMPSSPRPSWPPRQEAADRTVEADPAPAGQRAPERDGGGAHQGARGVAAPSRCTLLRRPRGAHRCHPHPRRRGGRRDPPCAAHEASALRESAAADVAGLREAADGMRARFGVRPMRTPRGWWRRPASTPTHPRRRRPGGLRPPRGGRGVLREPARQGSRSRSGLRVNLGQRRESAAQEFATQMAVHEQSLSEAEERATTLSAESEAALRQAVPRRSPARVRPRGGWSAGHGCRAKAERIRRDSERELAAATARRDSITAQLSNVRQMLSTLGGASMVEQLVEAAGPARSDPSVRTLRTLTRQHRGGRGGGRRGGRRGRT